MMNPAELLAAAKAADDETLAGAANLERAEAVLSSAIGLPDGPLRQEVAAWARIAHARGSLRMGRTLDAARSLHDALSAGADALRRGESAPWLGIAHHRQAIVNDVIGDAPAAVRSLREALTHYQRLGDDAAIGRVHNSMGIIYSRAGDYPHALERFATSLGYAERLGLGAMEVITLANQAITLRLGGRPEEAIRALRRALARTDEPGLGAYRFLALNNLGLALAAVGRHGEARDALDRATALLDGTQEPMHVAEHRRSRGEFFEGIGEPTEATASYEAALALADALGAGALIADLHECLARTTRALGRDEEADAHQGAWRRARATLDEERRRRELERETLQAELALLATEHARLATEHRQLRSAHAALAGEVAELRTAAMQDPLTGLANRRGFDALLARLTASDGRTGALVLVDLDHFKRVNDQHGHTVGDEILRGVAALLAREAGWAARLGGDEFALALPDADGATANAVAERLRGALHRAAAGDGRQPTASVGVATLAEAGGDATRLVLLADERLYQAKHAGGDRVYPAGMV